jgi:Family of unknown function (DUF6065)
MSSGPDLRPAGPALPELIAYTDQSASAVPVVPAPRWREWINSMPDRWANRCLPLIVANEAGWVLLTTNALQATWDGRDATQGLSIEFDQEVPSPRPALSIFGSGILTFPVPYLFRTPPGYNLLARGPANWPKDGICALEGLVETDWSVATFTMNWKLTRTNHPVRFEAGEPFCMIVPQMRGELESFRPVIRALESDQATQLATKAWSETRHQALVRKFLSEYSREYESEKRAWERHYYKGTAPDGTEAPEHQTHLKLSSFEREDAE